MSRTRRWVFTSGLALALAAGAVGGPAIADQNTTGPRALTEADYARAEKYMTYNTTPLVLRTGVRPTWLPDGRFWYRVTTENGSEAFLVDPVKAAKTPCDLPACTAGGQAGGTQPPARAEAAAQRGWTFRRLTGPGACSSGTGTSGSVTPRRRRKQR